MLISTIQEGDGVREVVPPSREALPPAWVGRAQVAVFGWKHWPVPFSSLDTRLPIQMLSFLPYP